ncbi:uncharacterized protein [Elaeis guineensis]|uniref:uncharacterized protein n=1 Tax=Elaeis guineensis var. tenera TaxID=51953 RepID=UPI003C6D398B
MAIYLQKVKHLVRNLRYFEIFNILRIENARVDVLFRLAMTAYSSLGRTFMECLEQPSIDKNENVLQLTAEPSWMDPIIEYLSDGVLLEDPAEAKRTRWAAFQYVMMDGRLYKRSFSLPLLKCLGSTDADYALREIHEEIYGSHLGGKSLANKILRQGYYWPTMKKDATDLVQRCEPCQKYAKVHNQPASWLTFIVAL